MTRAKVDSAMQAANLFVRAAAGILYSWSGDDFPAREIDGSKYARQYQDLKTAEEKLIRALAEMRKSS